VSWYLTVTRRAVGGSLVVTAAGRLGSAAAPELAAALRTAADEGLQVVLDLTGVDYISSAGIQIITMAASGLHSGGTTLLVRGASGATQVSLELAGPLANVSYPG
jgi:anti-anti-sigma factor